MKKQLLWAGLAWAGVSASVLPALARPSGQKHYKAVVLSKSGVGFGFGQLGLGRFKPVPASVVEVIQEQLSEVRTQWNAFNRSRGLAPLPASTFSVTVYEMAAPASKSLYVFEIQAGPFGWAMYYPVLVSKDDLMATTLPPQIWGKWFDGFIQQGSPILKAPYLRFVRLNGKELLAFESYAHNGTMYNAADVHYYEIGRHLQLKQVLVLERRVFVLPNVKGYKEPILAREPVGRGKDTLRVNVYLEDAEGAPKKRFVGYFIVKRAGASAPYRLVSQFPRTAAWKSVLVTASGESPEKFTDKGYDFVY